MQRGDAFIELVRCQVFPVEFFGRWRNAEKLIEADGLCNHAHQPVQPRGAQSPPLIENALDCQGPVEFKDPTVLPGAVFEEALAPNAAARPIVGRHGRDERFDRRQRSRRCCDGAGADECASGIVMLVARRVCRWLGPSRGGGGPPLLLVSGLQLFGVARQGRDSPLEFVVGEGGVLIAGGCGAAGGQGPGQAWRLGP